MGVDGEQLGIVSLVDAIAKAEAAELDLVEIAPTAKPPVCRIMDYGKFKYREAKKQHEAKLKLKQIQVKEVKFRPGTDEGDYKIKLRNLIRFLSEGDKTKVTLRFRGREMAHQEFGIRLLERIRGDLEPVCDRRTVSETRRTADGDAAGPEEDVAENASPGQARRRCATGRKSLSEAGEHRGGQQIKERHHAEDEDQERALRNASAFAETVRSSARRRSSATSSPRRPPRTSGSCAARRASMRRTPTPSQRCCRTRKEPPCQESNVA